MPRTLLVTNDFPPRPGGIQTYLQAFVSQLPADELVVYASRWKGSEEYDAAQPYEVVRHPTSLLVPSPDALGRARDLVRSHDIETVWFGAAAPLALLAAPLEAAGAQHSVACTHGHEVGWSMLPPSRACLRRIGDTTDVITYVSKYTRGRFAAAFGAQAALEHLPPGVDTDVFKPDAAARSELRARYGLGDDEPVVLCLSRLVPRKGQDMLIRALPKIRAQVPGAKLVIVGGGPYSQTLHKLVRSTDVEEAVIFTGGVSAGELAAHHNLGDVFAMPCRTRGAGLDVEGLGIVFLEASATGKPVVAGDSGGAPETVWEGESGHVVPGRDVDAIADAVAGLLADPDRAAAFGARGRELVGEHYNWRRLGHRLQTLLSPY
ncbi:Glycosyl transferase group 1 OS=Tsukamurella paurometabola (strain ATCC 8368 / DSM / CCUG 35730/ CIP 100753 / JCM 10117 / KCTC 9821 / NBRC 16120 / NCIMB 702349 / NCTC 13040) OX=521096 GN=Tpau_2681 PE=4 SV=1 [Tsukamurella paurometabola]|uniref:phosphatidyl-myo-inositol dimannoside synthase n=1 Tax=Tsukamurella paurometabola (strain ATCC 8368 / DSM 20162 / CCUG 35730 / CIP 100753 / JCM 10117 / KCTC 9821 / NBRC 16120 / NCIMB 702349 / NCTC 13040) TaxID=521096 RepID=D5USL0_TSUPD|nr:glycosyltransferase family 4 protein [Tsukamurella paurometabola]ADG79281.1 glycosyl transferase group 1 [Tsukamurella paurometabola DSM 20162]SUP34900.1 GDP-mannose-dependent alpha-(1-6)-phosphatidylinositol monomannoside mannosyltransferase [Tsukamurella paurometabola]